jgi:hypothetical protein
VSHLSINGFFTVVAARGMVLRCIHWLVTADSRREDIRCTRLLRDPLDLAPEPMESPSPYPPTNAMNQPPVNLDQDGRAMRVEDWRRNA